MSAPELGQDLLITRNRFEVNASLRSVWHMLSSIFLFLTCDKFSNSAFLRFTSYSQKNTGSKIQWAHLKNTLFKTIKQSSSLASLSRYVKWYLKKNTFEQRFQSVFICMHLMDGNTWPWSGTRGCLTTAFIFIITKEDFPKCTCLSVNCKGIYWGLPIKCVAYPLWNDCY